MTSFLQEEKYDIYAPLIRIQYEHWFTVALLGTCIDFCLRDIRLGTDIKRIDAPSSSGANQKNRNRKVNTHKRKSVGHKIDGIIYTTDELLELGAIEGARSFKGVSDNKYLDEEFKMPKSLQDMYSDLIRAVNYDDQRADKLQVIGILHLGLCKDISIQELNEQCSTPPPTSIQFFADCKDGNKSSKDYGSTHCKKYF
nr:13875_t:CDS:2 [Entrophospora candida]